MTSAPRDRREEVRDPLASGEVRMAALVAALRAVKPEDAQPARQEDDDAGTVRRAA